MRSAKQHAYDWPVCRGRTEFSVTISYDLLGMRTISRGGAAAARRRAASASAPASATETHRLQRPPHHHHTRARTHRIRASATAVGCTAVPASGAR